MKLWHFSAILITLILYIAALDFIDPLRLYFFLPSSIGGNELTSDGIQDPRCATDAVIIIESGTNDRQYWKNGKPIICRPIWDHSITSSEMPWCPIGIQGDVEEKHHD